MPEAMSYRSCICGVVSGDGFFNFRENGMLAQRTRRRMRKNTTVAVSTVVQLHVEYKLSGGKDSLYVTSGDIAEAIIAQQKGHYWDRNPNAMDSHGLARSVGDIMGQSLKSHGVKLLPKDGNYWVINDDTIAAMHRIVESL